jgi:hypothetical protein
LADEQPTVGQEAIELLAAARPAEPDQLRVPGLAEAYGGFLTAWERHLRTVAAALDTDA